MSRPIPPSYKTRNWRAYNEALKRRGSLTIWFDPEITWEAKPTGKRGRQPTYSDAAIQTAEREAGAEETVEGAGGEAYGMRPTVHCSKGKGRV